MASKKFTRNIDSIESDAYYTAAEVLLIGLTHIKEHEMSYPITMTAKQWADTVNELIWLMGFMIGDDTPDAKTVKRYKKAKKLLGKHFDDIWC